MKKIIAVILVMFIGAGLLAACQPRKRGEFYTLEKAYEEGFLTVDDLKNIQYYWNPEYSEEGFEPMPKDPEELSKSTVKAIQETSAYFSRKCEPKVKPDDFTIRFYYGTYNGYVAVEVSSFHFIYPDIVEEKEIGGVMFINPNHMQIWRAN